MNHIKYSIYARSSTRIRTTKPHKRLLIQYSNTNYFSIFSFVRKKHIFCVPLSQQQEQIYVGKLKKAHQSMIGEKKIPLENKITRIIITFRFAVPSIQIHTIIIKISKFCVFIFLRGNIRNGNRAYDIRYAT